MPALSAEKPLSVFPNNQNSNFEATSRKSNEKTISGVFAYTNGTDVETGLPDHRLEQLKVTSGSQGSLANGVNSQSSRSGRDRTPSNAGSTHSVGSRNARNGEYIGRNSISAEVTSKLSRIENTSDLPLPNGYSDPLRLSQLDKLKTDQTADPKPNASDPSPASSLQPDGLFLSSNASRLQPSLGRFSSPPMTSSPDRYLEPTKPPDLPKLTQRHTLQIPRASTGIPRDSREFSFTAGASEEVITATGRVSPTREQDGTMSRRRRASIGLTRKITRTASEAYLDEIPLDEEAARWTEVIKQKRATRRKRKEEEDEDRVIVGKKVEEGHVNWVTAYNMLTGIRFTVSRTNAKIDRPLTDGDFDAKHKFSFDVTGNELTPSAKYDFKFKDYSPWVFRHLRSLFGLDPADYLMSLTSKYILSELGSPGKSGSFFYFSRDYKYIIKTIHHAEHKLLRRILRDYYDHVKSNPNTLISQFYGLHRVKIPYGRKIHFVVMNNLFPPHRDIHQTFDLKGSTIGRDFKEEDLASNPRATLKDLNWLRRDLHLEFEPQIRTTFIEQLQRDVQLLQRLQIMDYSLLVGMHDLEKGNEEKLRETTLKIFQPGGDKDEDGLPGTLMRTPSRLENARKARELRQTLKKEKPVPMGQAASKMPDEMREDERKTDRLFYSDGGGIRATHEDGSGADTIYYLGVIDCLTYYGFVKRLEHFWKGLSNNSSQISPIPPQSYGERFLNFITGITMTKEEADRRITSEGNRSSVDAHNALHHHHFPEAEMQNTDGYADDQISSPRDPEAVEETMIKAQKSTDKQTSDKGRRRSEQEDVPDRTIGTYTDENKPQALLPVVAEAGEGSSQLSEKSERQLSTSNGKDTSESNKRSEEFQYFNEKPEALDLTEEQTRMQEIDAEYIEKRSSKPPRIASGIIPTLTPLINSSDPFEEFKRELK